ncbi:N-acetylmuramoyl-L-alanine amidase [Lysinibacillus sp. AC-3]|uniref:N-acetylmuramoyl-L-alanine amidase n=1 Tax=unclassified Lysinibacillus TaxID=2636778 RepID=UPI0009C61116|nr:MULTISPECIES: N-acetylmuramoyl-L-alanine amidase [unclassified Lysinibacillus]SKB60178.1 N-acetylmuramoyl-L-alanine amidase [Lysinibacillus sp. AC-3]
MTKRYVGSSGHSLKIRGAKCFIDEVDEARKVTNEVHRILTTQYNGAGSVFHDDTSTTQNQNLQTIVNYHNKQTRELDWSIHFNAANVTDAPRGVEVLYYDMKDLSAKVSAAISKASGLKDRGPKQRTELYFLKNTYKPAILIEVCFVDSEVDVDLYHKNFNVICTAIAEILAEHLGYAKIQTGQPADAKIMLNDSKTIPAVIIDGRTHVQVREIAELLGLKLVYNNESKTTKLYEVK